MRPTGIKGIDTDRLRLAPFTAADAASIVELLNQPSFLEHIGDKGVRTLDDARRYLADGPITSYRQHGFGLLAVRRKGHRKPVGMCGLLKRPALDHPDIGFAFLPAVWRRGYALEAAAAVLAQARDRLGIGRVLAITSPGNAASIALLGKLGFVDDGRKQLDAAGEAVQLFSRDLIPAGEEPTDM